LSGSKQALKSSASLKKLYGFLGGQQYFGRNLSIFSYKRFPTQFPNPWARAKTKRKENEKKKNTGH